MRRLARLATAAAVSGAVLATGASAPAIAQNGPYDAPPSFSAMVSDKLPAVVGILSTVNQPEIQTPGPQLPPGLEDFFGMPGPQTPPPGPMRGQGSGFIISADGFLVTNNHVVAGADEIEVVLEDERRLPAELIGTDPATDIALLKVDADGKLPFVEWGASEALEIGDWVVAIGNPFGLGGTVTAGIVSARSRNIQSGPYDDFIQTDAAINRGNSGGPLFDENGDVVGVNTAIFSPTGGNIGIGFAVPSQVAAQIVADLRDDGQVERGWLGVQIQPVTEELAGALALEDTMGALVADVTAGSPAEEADLRPGDVIVGFDGEEVADPRELTFAVAEIDPDTEVSVTIVRDGERVEETVSVGLQPALGPAPMGEPGEEDTTGTPMLGLSVAPLDDQLRSRLAIEDDIEGVAVLQVQPRSPASEAGISQGDVILSASGTDIAEVGDLREAAGAAADEDRPLLLRLYRNGNYVFRAVTLDTEDDSDG